MRTFVTSDLQLHFNHRNISKFCPKTRGHWDSRNDPDTMNEDMIAMWNNLVSPEDTVYNLGDVAFGSVHDAVKILNRLNGNIILIEGNHDKKALRDPFFAKRFTEIHKYLDITYAGHKIIMCHYPFLEWDQMHRGALHFHGHLHGNKTGQENFRCMDVGFDATGKIVMLMEDAINMIKNNDVKQHH